MNKMYTTDTHSFLWYITEDDRGENAKESFEKCDNEEDVMIVPSIVLIEALFMCEKKRVNIDFDKVLLKLRISSNYQIYPLDGDVVFECKNIKLPDPHDRIIVATAKLLNARLITKDEEITKSSLMETVW